MSNETEVHVVTMVFDEEDYLTIWLKYWRQQLPDDLIHVLCHGENAKLAALAQGVNFTVVPRPAPYETMEEDRWVMLSDRVSAMTGPGRVVVYTDVDEILIADPKTGQSITQLLAQCDAPVSHAIGLELIHRTDKEPDEIDLNAPILQQRQYYRTTSFHSKPCVATAPIRWGRGGHFSDQNKMQFAKGIYAIHLRFYDRTRFLERARGRREKTKARAELNAIAHRRWRNSETEAVKLVDSFLDWPLPPLRSLVTFRLLAKMRRTRKSKPNELGLFRYALFSGRLQKLPRRLLDAF